MLPGGTPASAAPEAERTRDKHGEHAQRDAVDQAHGLPLLPHRRQMQRLREQDLAELPAVHLNGRARIERASEALLGGLVGSPGNAAADCAHGASGGGLELEGLHPTS